jgi:23S rRNA pseudouridine1911/1915/1917 synthase
MDSELSILYEDNHLLVVDKPAGLLVQGDRSGDESLLERARESVRIRHGKPGNVYLGLVHRLDRNVSGVVVLARTSKAASRLSDQFRQRKPRKEYLAVAQGTFETERGELVAHLAAQADRQGVTRASSGPFDGLRQSRLEYSVLDAVGSGPESRSLLRIRLITGRRHQIRAQLGLIGRPLLGDVKYGARRGLPEHRIALHAESLELLHPVGARRMQWTAPVPGDWPWKPGAVREVPRA